ncbi:hypothetical protein LCGC14_2261870 [marine sediment metagenome]|uniref:Uncharacterized protein n=1 Tax=marine sediment metagenome TaxID=412755 RepID=A0A0F9FUJ7_9ZZZZ
MPKSIEFAIKALDQQIRRECDRLSCAFVAMSHDPHPSSPAALCCICRLARKYHRVIAD